MSTFRWLGEQDAEADHAEGEAADRHLAQAAQLPLKPLNEEAEDLEEAQETLAPAKEDEA